ncbi:uncharacterized protein LOC127976959 [Carassius gibelio]|uniref:uncharacterized protein LOC127976959 n=1 Tax=Carassius gibelio TaxID=101364 RepID=UPI002279BE7F|nr:uncharacterized protein LOC127976959 [Carassius gibelio]
MDPPVSGDRPAPIQNHLGPLMIQARQLALLNMAVPPKFSAPVLTPESSPDISPSSPLVPSSPPSSPNSPKLTSLAPPKHPPVSTHSKCPPEPAPRKCPPETAPPSIPPGFLVFPKKVFWGSGAMYQRIRHGNQNCLLCHGSWSSLIPTNPPPPNPASV